MKFNENQNRKTIKLDKNKSQIWPQKKKNQKFVTKNFKWWIFTQKIYFLQWKFNKPTYVTSGQRHEKFLNINSLIHNEVWRYEKLYNSILWKIITIFSKCVYKQKIHFLKKNKFIYLFLINALTRRNLLEKNIDRTTKKLFSQNLKQLYLNNWLNNYGYYLINFRYCDFISSISQLSNQKNNKPGRKIGINPYYNLWLHKLYQKNYILKTLKNLTIFKNEKVLTYYKKKWSQKRYVYQIYKKSLINNKLHSRWKPKRSKNKKKLNSSKKISLNRPRKEKKKLITITTNSKKGKHK